jgi:hypothetical protein
MKFGSQCILTKGGLIDFSFSVYFDEMIDLTFKRYNSDTVLIYLNYLIVQDSPPVCGSVQREAGRTDLRR